MADKPELSNPASPDSSFPVLDKYPSWSSKVLCRYNDRSRVQCFIIGCHFELHVLFFIILMEWRLSNIGNAQMS